MADKAGSKPKPEKSKAPEKDKAKAKAKGDKAADAPAAAETPKPPPEPRKPADPRLKVLKKFHGKFLPKGPLRQRHQELMKRWDSGEDHGGVTVEELKALLDDWRASRAKPSRAKTPV